MRVSSHTAWLFMLLLTCGIHCSAQSYYEEVPKVFTGGLILGANFAQVDGDTYYGFYKVGVNAGATVQVRFSEIFSAGMELLYVQKGVRGLAVVGSQYGSTYAQKYYLDLNYAEVPVLLHIKPGSKCPTYLRADFETGVSYARLINFKEYAENDQPVYFNPTVNYFKNSDVDLVAGINYKIYKNLHLNFRYQYSLTTIRDAARIPVGFGYGNAGQYNNTCTLRLKYIF
jgi:hypothetical protein